MIVCAQTTIEDFYVIIHEMGHIQYYKAYQNQPAIFKVSKAIKPLFPKNLCFLDDDIKF
jgi:Angiotensin-converting enzyme